MRRLVPCLAMLAIALRPPTLAGAADPSKGPGDRVFGVSPVIQLHLTLTEKQFADLAPPGSGRFGPPGFGPPGFGPPSGPGRPRPDGVQPDRQQPIAPPAAADDAHRNTFGIELPWSRGNLEFAGDSYADVGVRYKGNYTYIATARALKKSLKIDLNKHVKEQKLDGLTKLSLHCGVSDPTQTREALSYAFFRDAGVPAPRTCFAELTLTVPGKYDREFVGMYTLVEQVNKTFLRRHFGDDKGLLLKPEGLQGGPAYLGPEWKAYENRYNPDDTATAEQQRRLIEFTRIVSESSDDEFAQQIGQYLEVDAFLRFIATNALLANLDSYLGYGHNYYLYLVPSTNKFVFIPWDLDLSLATWPAAGSPEQLVELSIHHPHAGQNKLIDRLFAVPEHKERYLAIIRELLSSCFTKEKFLEHFERLEAAVKQPLAKEAQAIAARQEKETAKGPSGRGPFGGFGGFGNGQFGQSMPPRRFIDRRLESVGAQLAGRSTGFEPRPFGAGFGPPPGPPRNPPPNRR